MYDSAGKNRQGYNELHDNEKLVHYVWRDDAKAPEETKQCESR